MVQAKWNNKKFEITDKKLNPISDLSTSYELNSKTTTDKNGKSKTVRKGVKAQTVTFKTTALCVKGVNPKTEFESYKKLIGKKSYLYLGSKKFGPYLMLTKVSLDNVVLKNNGDFAQVDMTLTFEQTSKSSTTKKNGKKKTFKVGSKVKIKGSKWYNGKKVKKADKAKTFKIKKISKNVVTLSNGKKIAKSSLSLV